jgi:hypothetical protein
MVLSLRIDLNSCGLRLIWRKWTRCPAEVTTWLDRAYQTVLELDPIETGILQVQAQFLHNDVPRHSTEIANTLHRVEEKLRARVRQGAS